MAQASVNRPRRTLAQVASLLLFVAAAMPSARAQGCAQCRDNAAATPPRTQAAYRHAIFLLGGAGAILFGGTILVLKRSR